MNTSKLFIALIVLYLLPCSARTLKAQELEWITHINYSIPDGSFIKGLDCFDSDNCILIKQYGFGFSDTLYKTTNGGIDWTPIRNQQNLITQRPVYRGVAYPSPDVMIACGDSGHLIRTINGGETWESKQIVPKERRLNKIVMPTPQHGIIWVSHVFPQYIIATSDSGKTWDSIKAPEPPGLPKWGMADVACPSPNIFFCLTSWKDVTVLARSDNGGQSWTYMPLSPIRHELIYFSSKDSGWMISIPDRADKKGARDVLSRTTDGGVTWKAVIDSETSIGARFGLSDLSFADSLHGLVVGTEKVFRTSDGGKTWKQELIDYSGLLDFLRVSYKPNSNGIIVSSQGRVLRYIGKSTDVEYSQTSNIPFYLAPNTVPAGVVPVVSYQLPQPATISISLVTVAGEEKVLQPLAEQDAGLHQFQLPTDGLPSGLHFIRITNNQQSRVLPFLVTR